MQPSHPQTAPTLLSTRLTRLRQSSTSPYLHSTSTSSAHDSRPVVARSTTSDRPALLRRRHGARRLAPIHALRRPKVARARCRRRRRRRAINQHRPPPPRPLEKPCGRFRGRRLRHLVLISSPRATSSTNPIAKAASPASVLLSNWCAAATTFGGTPSLAACDDAAAEAAAARLATMPCTNESASASLTAGRPCSRSNKECAAAMTFGGGPEVIAEFSEGSAAATRA